MRVLKFPRRLIRHLETPDLPLEALQSIRRLRRYLDELEAACILKARQLGFSTLLGVVCADRLCFGMGQQISLVDQTLEDARQKLRDITLVATKALIPRSSVSCRSPVRTRASWR